VTAEVSQFRQVDQAAFDDERDGPFSRRPRRDYEARAVTEGIAVGAVMSTVSMMVTGAVWSHAPRHR